ncbi:MAG TPA: hypothetical protein VGY66_08805, partial [Gemmataceae bacterium]|nr:hypothetical protein [Gemmataceae bacterium]
FERIQKGMTLEQVEAILGERPPFASGSLGKFYLMWQDGPSWIDVAFADGDNTVRDKELHLATVPEILTWYGKKVAAKIGVKWD